MIRCTMSNKCRIYPKKDQTKKFEETLKITTQVYNNLKQQYIKDKKENPKQKYHKEYFYKNLQEQKKQYPQINNIDKTIPINTYHDILTEIRIKKEKINTEYKETSSFKIQKNKNIKIKDKTLTLAEYGKLKLHTGKNKFGKIKQIRIKKQNNKWYAIIISTYYTDNRIPKNKKCIGIDIGIKDLITLSNGKKIKAPDLTKIEEKIKKEYRKLSRKIYGSQNYQKQLEKLKNAEQKKKNIINDTYHKITTKLVEEYDIIIMEKLKINPMRKNHRYSKNIQKMNWYKLTQMIKYKCYKKGKIFIQVSSQFPSTKLCNNCNYLYKDITIEEREWTCPKCKQHHDRDINAAKNILKEGLKQI